MRDFKREKPINGGIREFVTVYWNKISYLKSTGEIVWIMNWHRTLRGEGRGREGLILYSFDHLQKHTPQSWNKFPGDDLVDDYWIFQQMEQCLPSTWHNSTFQTNFDPQFVIFPAMKRQVYRDILCTKYLKKKKKKRFRLFKNEEVKSKK